MGDQEEDFSSLPLTDRFVHKQWKVRKGAYEDAAKMFEKTASEDDPAFRPFLQDSSLWKSAVADSNVAAHQEALAALCAFLKFGGRDNCTRSRGHTVASIVEKGLPSTRAAAKASALEALLLYVELDAAGPVVEEMLPMLSHKQPKIIAADLAALAAVYHNYGCKVVDPKPVLKLLPKVFGHADKNVRAEATNLAVELYRWLREAVKPMFWADLKPTQQADLEAQFDKAKAEPVPKQERLLRTQQEAMARAPAPGEGDEEGGAGQDEGEADEFVEVDAFDLAEPKDVLKDVPANFYENLASSKWKDRKEAVEALHAVVNVPRIKDGDFNELNRGLAKCMKDANVAVVTQAAQCIEALARGLRKGYAKHRTTVMQPIMERLKEKKQTVADALGAALDAVFLSTSLSDCLEDVTAFLVNKNPQVKEGTMRFLIRCLRTTREVPSKPEIAGVVESAKKLLAESSEGLRSGGAEILGTVMKIIGERAMNPYMDGLDDIRKTKIKEYFETAEVKAKEKKPKPPPPAAKAPAASGPAGAKKTAAARKAAPAGLKKPAAAAPDPAPLAPQPSSRGPPPSSKLGTARPGSMKPPPAPKRALGAGMASPKRVPQPPPPSSSPSPSFDDDEPPPPPPPPSHPARPGGVGRGGLTGRSLAKPTVAAAHPAPPPPLSPPPSSSSSGLTPIERVEMEELRIANDRLMHQLEDMRQERNKLVSEIQELKNQNAGLIEDHTRDVLSIKAKETQLVRARSDAEASEQTNERLCREMERLKRALNAAEGLGHPRPGSALGSPGRGSSPTPDDVVAAGVHRDRFAATSSSSSSAAAAGRNRTSYASNLSEEKENGYESGTHAGSKLEARYRSGGVGVPTSGRNSPARGFRSMASMHGDDGHHQSSQGEERQGGGGFGNNNSSSSSSSSISTVHANGSGGGGGGDTASASGTGTTGPVESWKRAAEVTSQLKARIELMKAKQGLARP